MGIGQAGEKAGGRWGPRGAHNIVESIMTKKNSYII